MDLKTEFVKFIKEELNIPLVGITLPEDFSQEDVERISYVIKAFAEATPLAKGADIIVQPKDFLGEGCTICRVMYPSLLKILEMTDEQWENTFAQILVGFFLIDKSTVSNFQKKI